MAGRFNRGNGDAETGIVAARAFVEAVAKGETGADVGAGPGSSEVQKMLAAAKEKAKAYAAVTAAERRDLVMGAMIEVLTRGEYKDRVAAARVLAMDPELGFQTGPQVAVVITDEVLGLPGRPRFRPETEEN